MKASIRDIGWASAIASSSFLLPLLALSLLLSAPAFAEDLRLKNGRLLKNITVYKKGPEGIVIFHETGVGTFGPDKLPTSFLKDHGIKNPQALKATMAEAQAKAEAEAKRAAAQRRTTAAEEARLDALYKNAVPIMGQVISPTGTGAIVSSSMPISRLEAFMDARSGNLGIFIYHIEGASHKSKVGAWLVVPNGTYTYNSAGGVRTVANLRLLPHREPKKKNRPRIYTGPKP